MGSDSEDLKKTIGRINSVSKSFCAAKWKQVIVHLHTGQTQSCHHPGTHRVPLKELKADLSALHNTTFKKFQRLMMLQGERPSECQYCWNIEDLGQDSVSDRYIKSNDEWAAKYIDEIKELPWDANVDPTFLEVIFSNTCNFKCIYCLPQVSSRWQSDLLQHGPIHLEDGEDYLDITHWKDKKLSPLIDENKNPYIRAFWKWLPQIYPKLHVLRVTGGEPLLSDQTFKLLKFVEDHPSEKLTVAVNTNLGVPFRKIEEFAAAFKKIKGSVGSLQVYTSIDSWGPQAEYIRTGMDLQQFTKNIDFLFEQLPDLKLTFMCAFNIFSPFSILDLLKKIQELKEKHSPNGAQVIFDAPYLKHPEFLSVLIMDPRHLPLLEEAEKYMYAHQSDDSSGKPGFNFAEIEKMKRIIELYKSGYGGKFDREKHRRNFLMYVKEMDRRNGTDFTEVFPELAADLKTDAEEDSQSPIRK